MAEICTKNRFDFIPQFVIMLYSKGVNTNNYTSIVPDSAYLSHMLDCSVLNGNTKINGVFGESLYHSNSITWSKTYQSSDKKTIYWYAGLGNTPVGGEQFNSYNIEYCWLAFGR